MRRLVAGVVVAVLAAGCTSDADRLGGVEQDPMRSGDRPRMPVEFGDWGLFQRHDRDSAYFTTEDLTRGVHVSSYAPGEFDRRLEGLQDAELIGNWWCGSLTSITMTTECFTLAWDEEVNLSSEHLEPEELAGFGDEMLQAWTGATS